MTEKLLGTLAVLFDYVGAIAPHGVMGGVVLIFGFLILALAIDRIRANVSEMSHNISDLSRKVDALTLATGGHRGDAEGPTVEARDSGSSLEEIRKRLEALSTRADPKFNTNADEPPLTKHG